MTHGGLLSMYETVYHGVPVVTLPVFCDHDANAAKAALDGYAHKLDLQHLTSETLYQAIKEVIDEPRYRHEVKKRQILLRDQNHSPLEKAIYWTEYVIRHKGAYHLQSPARDLNYFQYHMLDVAVVAIVLWCVLCTLTGYCMKVGFRRFLGYLHSRSLSMESKLIYGSNNNLLNHSDELMNHASIVKKRL